MTAPVTSAPDDLPTELAAAPIPTVPDRANAPVSEVVERFLRAVITSVPLDRLEELHLFSPLRQGTVETGIAVLAARIPVMIAGVVSGEATGEPELFDGAADGTELAGDATIDDAVIAGAEGGGDTADQPGGDDVRDAEEAEEAEATEEIEAAVIAADGPDESAAVSAPIADEDGSLHAEEDLPARPERLTVYTARYRYVIKGPERGKWEASVVAEADAPLITVETVVRGVQRRAGEDSEIVRYTAAQIARALRMPYPA